MANRAFLQPWEPSRDDEYFELGAISQRLATMAEKTACGEALHLLMLRDGQIIGSCNFTTIVRGAFQACHLGYALDESAQGQGLMHEALSTERGDCLCVRRDEASSHHGQLPARE